MLFDKDFENNSLQQEKSLLQQEKDNIAIEKNNLAERVSILENDKKKQHEFSKALKEFEDKKNSVIKNNLNNYPRYLSAFWWYFCVNLFIVIAFLIINYTIDISNLYLKILVPFFLFFLTQILSLFNKDRIITSFKFNFNSARFEKKLKNEFLEDFNKTNKIPNIEDF